MCLEKSLWNIFSHSLEMFQHDTWKEIISIRWLNKIEILLNIFLVKNSMYLQGFLHLLTVNEWIFRLCGLILKSYCQYLIEDFYSVIRKQERIGGKLRLIRRNINIFTLHQTLNFLNGNILSLRIWKALYETL